MSEQPIAEREKPCVWTPEGEDSSSWNTGCGNAFWLDDGCEGVNFCPFCGHPAVFAEQDEQPEAGREYECAECDVALEKRNQFRYFHPHNGCRLAGSWAIGEIHDVRKGGDETIIRLAGEGAKAMSVTHCEHGIDRAYRCIDCIEAERDALRASIAALADEWDVIAKRQRDQAEMDSRRDYADSAAVKDGKASGYEACARELRQLAEGAKR